MTAEYRDHRFLQTVEFHKLPSAIFSTENFSPNQYPSLVEMLPDEMPHAENLQLKTEDQDHKNDIWQMHKVGDSQFNRLHIP